jgi:hypothetical protein
MLDQNMQDYLAKLNPANHLLRTMLVMVVYYIFALLLGIAFFIIALGFSLGVRWFFLYWEPAFRIYTKALKIQNVTFMKMPMPWWRVVILVLKACIVLWIVYIGAKILINDGFLAQNLIL